MITINPETDDVVDSLSRTTEMRTALADSEQGHRLAIADIVSTLEDKAWCRGWLVGAATGAAGIAMDRPWPSPEKPPASAGGVVTLVVFDPCFWYIGVLMIAAASRVGFWIYEWEEECSALTPGAHWIGTEYRAITCRMWIPDSISGDDQDELDRYIEDHSDDPDVRIKRED